MGLFDELEGSRTVERIRRTLRGFGDDPSSSRLRVVTGDALDPGVPGHRAALLSWLRSWGCRHLRVADTGRSSRALASWWRAYGSALPTPTRTLVDLSDGEVFAAATAYVALATRPAARRAAATGPVSVSFGETAAAKALFAIRPLAFPPWDAPIRVALGLEGEEGYRSYLEQVAGALRVLGVRLGLPVPDVPAALGRPGSSPPRLVDEYLWMRVNRDA